MINCWAFFIFPLLLHTIGGELYSSSKSLVLVESYLSKYLHEEIYHF